MKKLILFIILIIVSIALSFNYSPENIPFNYDPNQIIGTLLGGAIVEVGLSMIVDVNCTDANGDPFTIIAVNPPIGLYVINIAGANIWQVQWTPNSLQEGLWYVTIEATDIPPHPKLAKSTKGTIVIQVISANQAPVLHPIKDSPVVMNIWPNDYQKRWQELKKRGTIIYGPVVMAL